MLTSDQQRALAWDHHVSVTANAGTGKTTVLVERYLALLASGAAPPSAILVLTFTEKAAGELKLRIASRLAAAADTAQDPADAERFQMVRKDLAGAFIGTIHAFCARTLREFPVEAGVDASFSVVEGLDQRLMLSDAVHATLQEQMRAAADGGARILLQDLLHEKGRGGVYRLLTALVERRALIEQLTGRGGLYNRSDRSILSFWRDGLAGELDFSLRDPFLHESIERLLEAAAGRGAAVAREAFHDIANAADMQARATAYERLTSAMLRSDGRLAASFKRSNDGGSALALWETTFLSRNRAIRPLLPVALDPRLTDELHRVLLRSARFLLGLTQESVERYEERKLETARLDFEDLQLRARHLFTNEAVRRRLSERYRFIMVDEYQDTNLLQYEILLPLVSGLREGNLFIVGDPKQSIYAFRGADVTVFEKTRSDITSAAGPPADVLLAQSFRPLRNLAAFVNLVFSRAMTGDEFDVRYDALIQARENSDPGRVELLVSNSEEERGVPEGETIARRILQLREARTTVYDRTEQPRELRFADVGVLMRSRSVLPELEAALVRHRIPYVVTAGTGFFQTQEVADVYSYLRFLLSSSDDVALITLLRSPFFAVSDVDLFSVLHDRPPGDIWSFLSASPRELGHSVPLARAVRMLSEDRTLLARLPVHEAIACLLDRTHYLAKHVGTSWGEQSVANLLKLQEIVRAFERQGFVGLRDFVLRLRSLMEEEENEGQGTAGAGRDAVQVMTVHAAKGREFPVVVLPRLRAGVQAEREPFIDPFWGLGFVPPGVDGEEGPEPPLTGFLRVRSRMRALAEEKRIFYVACTRARDMLLLSTDGIESGGKVTPMTWVASALELGGGELPARVERTVRTGLAIRQMPAGSDVVEVEHQLHIPVLQGADLPDRIYRESEPSRVAAPAVTALDPLASTVRGEVYELEEIGACAACPHLFRRLFILGLGSTEEQRRKEHARQCKRELWKTALWHASERAMDRKDGVRLLSPLADTLVGVNIERVFTDETGIPHTFIAPSVPPGLPEHIIERVTHVMVSVASAALVRAEGFEGALLHLVIATSAGRCKTLTVSAAEYNREGESILGNLLTTLRYGPFEHRADPCDVCASIELRK